MKFFPIYNCSTTEVTLSLISESDVSLQCSSQVPLLCMWKIKQVWTTR